MRSLLTAAVLFAATSAFASAEVFQKKCAGCHGPDGTGQTKMADKIRAETGRFPNFTSASFHEKHDAAVIENSITNGVDGTKMKPFKDKLGAEEIKSLVKVVQGFKK